MATTEKNRKAFKILSVIEIIFAICASLSWSGGYILQEFIHVDPMSVAYDIWVTTFEFYFIGFPIAFILSIILLSMNSDSKIMNKKPLILLCICPLAFAFTMYLMIVVQSSLFFLLGSVVLSAAIIITQIHFITELKKSKNYIPPVEPPEPSIDKRRNIIKRLAAVNAALILITTACFMIPPWLSLYNLADISDASVPLFTPMALGLIFGSILLIQNAETGFLPAHTVNTAFAFEFLFPTIVWISNKIHFELSFTGPDYTPEVIRDSVVIKIGSVAFSLIALIIAVFLIRDIVKMKNEPSYSTLSNKKSSLWTLYVLNIFPATMYSITTFETGISNINWETDYDFIFFDTPLYKGFSELLERLDYSHDGETTVTRLILCGILIFTVYILLAAVGKKSAFSKAQTAFLFSPFIISFVPYIINFFFRPFPDADDVLNLLFGILTTLGTALFVATQIFIIVKLIKFSKIKELT